MDLHDYLIHGTYLLGKIITIKYINYRLILKGYLTKRLKFDEKERKLWENYGHKIFCLPESSETAFHRMF